MKNRPAWKQASFDFSAPPSDDPPVQTVPVQNGVSHAARLKRKGQLRLFDSEPPPQVLESAPPADSKPACTTCTPRVAPAEFSSGLVAKARDIIAAIRTLKRIEQEARPATAEEKTALSRFCGFGPVATHIFTDPLTGKFKDGSWQAIGAELRELLTDEEYDSAKRTTFNAFYTAPVVMRAMHDALSRFGVPSSATVLEPGCGIGRFASCAPDGMHFIGVELDSLSARIAKALHPDHDIRNENFRDSKIPQLDAVIGNVPFADIKLDWKGTRYSLHDYFFAKSVDALKPGGVLALVTSHFTMDKQNAAIRDHLSSQADFLGAIRLPSDAFKTEGTAVVTDIIFLRKRGPDQPENHVDYEWKETAPLSVEDSFVTVNRYFINHPEMVLGNWSLKDTMYGGEGFSITSDGDLGEHLQRSLQLLPQSHQVKPATPQVKGVTHQISPKFVPPPQERHVSEGSFFVDHHIIYQMVNGRGEPVVYGGTKLTSNGTMTGRRLASLIQLRDQARRVLQSQNEDWPEENRIESRTALNLTYDHFVKAYGAINKTTLSDTKDGSTIRRMPNLVKFREDPDAMLVMSLEEYDEATDKAEKATIMKRDVVGKTPPVTSVKSAEEGLLVSLNEHGRIDLPFMSAIYKKPEADIIEELGSLIYLDPETKEWETADSYLSGTVRDKLKAADAAGPEFARNADALRKVQPEDVLPGDIDANLGAPWIPPEDIQAFAAELFGVAPQHIPVSYLKKDALWTVEASHSAERSVPATADYGTPRANGTTLFEQALNMKSPVIYDPDPNDSEKRVVNPTETLAAKEKQKLIKEKFKAWAFADPDRSERLVRLYNDAFNNLRPRLFDGSHLTFPGMNPAITLRPHQTAAVWRCMVAGNTLLAHAVGAGKTNVCVAAAMKMKQTGLIKKPMCVVPNHMLEQFSREWLQLYPNAKLLIAGKEDFTKERRKLLTAKIATGDWDGIIVTHSSFERIGMSDEYQERFLREQIAEYSDLLIEHAGKKSSNRNIVKQLEKQKANREQKLKDLLAEDKKDEGLVFDELGVDQVFIDECFTYGTLVETDQGQIPIGRIVNERLCVNIKSLNPATGALEWKPVVNWFANKRRGHLIEVSHEHGSFICTPNHKLWIAGHGYRKAGDLAGNETLLVLQEGLYSELRQGRAEAETLLPGMQSIRQHGHEAMCDVRDGLHVHCEQSGNGCEEAPEVLQRVLQNEDAAREPSFARPVETGDAADLGKSAAQRATESRFVRLDDGQQPDETARGESKAIGGIASHRASAQDQRRQWPSIALRNASRGSNRDADSLCNHHQTHPGSGAGRAETLQGRPCRSDQDACGRGGREHAQQPESSRAGYPERQSPITSRVVGVAILEPGRDGEYRFSGRDHSIVYDIEVADNHNYFANGTLVSNCQAYKNLETPTKMDRVAGIQTGGSERAFDVYMKARYLDQQHAGHGIVGASGTPISNSMVEMYTMQRYFDPAGLRARGIEHFDAWAATFGEVVESMEISPDGKSLRPRSRFAKFVNLPELQQMFRAFSDVQTAEMLNLPRPKLAGGKPQTIACPMSDDQAAIQQELVERYEKLRSQKVDPRVDNALNITTDGRKLALDARMIDGGAALSPESKINRLVENVLEIGQNSAAARGTQMIFCDMGVHPTAWGFSAYDEITRKLIQEGIPASQIANIGDADTDAKKQVLFQKVRQGAVRVLLGSTQKMGTGTNVQKRLIALHHLDAPWKPAEVEQRDGRILRQGNDNPEIQIFRYVTEGSFDAYMWQALETKAKFIAQVMSGENTARKAEDVGGQELSYAEVKAIASGNPAVLTLAETDAELKRLSILKKNHSDEQFLARRNIRDLPGTIKRLTDRVANMSADAETIETTNDSPLMIGGRRVAHGDEVEVLGGKLETLPEKVSENRQIPLGKYYGLEFGIILHPHFTPDAYLEGRSHREAMLSKNAGPRAVLNALARIADSYRSEITTSERDLELAKSQLSDFEQRLGRKFEHEAYMTELTTLRDQLRTGLSEAPKEGMPTVSDIAGQIKVLKSSQAVEAAPEREAVRVSAEEPVTARIKRQMEQPDYEPVAATGRAI